MSDLIFYTHPWSRGRIVRWMLEECGADYQTEVLEYGTSMKSDEYLAINPMGKVPALKDGDVVVTEAAAICTYLADRFPDKQLAPDVNSKARGDYYRWLYFTAGPIEAVTTAKALDVLPPETETTMPGYGNLDHVVNALELALKDTTYLCANHFTAADLYLSACVGWYMEFGMLPKKAVFEKYVEAHRNRPAAQKAFEMDEELSKEYPVPG